MDKRIFAGLILALFVFTPAASAKRILFYEVNTNKDFTIESGYSKFAQELRKTYEVASITKGSLTKDKLENYDILVIQELGRSLNTDEISSIIWFVLQKGRGLYINGGGGGKANQLSIPFGVTIDTGTLIDITDQIPKSNSHNNFVINRFIEHSTMKSLRRGVSKVGFYKGSGLILSGNTKCIMSGDSDTYSNTGSFAAGSEPCVAAASQFGGGLVVVQSDSGMNTNKHIEEYNNKNFGLNVIEWLSIATGNVSLTNSTTELQLQIKELRLNNLRLEQEVKQLSEEKKDLSAKYTQAKMQSSQLQQELLDLQAGMIGPFSRSNWAIIILGVCLLMGAIVFSKRKGGEEKVKDDDILNELGYELEDSGGDKIDDEDLDDLKI